MKTGLILAFLLVAFLLPGRARAGAEMPVEEKLAGLQIEEVALRLKYRAQSPQLAAVAAEIKELEKIPEIRGAKYYEYLAVRQAGLEKEREEQLKKLRPGNPALAETEAKIAFVKKTLAERPAPAS